MFAPFLYRPPFRCLSLRKSTGNCENFHGQLEKNSWATGEKMMGNVLKNYRQCFLKWRAMFFKTIGHVLRNDQRWHLLSHSILNILIVNCTHTYICVCVQVYKSLSDGGLPFSHKFWKNRFTKLIMSNMSLTFALFASRKGTQSVERGEGILLLFRKVLLTLSSKVKSRRFGPEWRW